MSLPRALLVVGATLGLASCGVLFHDRANDYRTAQDLTPLVIPPGQDARPIAPLYAIPPAMVCSRCGRRSTKCPSPSRSLQKSLQPRRRRQ